MAKKGSSNRTEKVREYVSNNPDHSISETESALANQGIKVSRSLISQVRKALGVTQSGAKKSRKKKKMTKKRATGKKAVAARATSAKAITADDLYEAKKLADELGGISRVREALDALEKLR